MRFTRGVSFLIAGVASLALATDAAAGPPRGHRHGRGGYVVVRSSFGFHSGPFWAGYGSPWWGPIAPWGYYGHYGPGPAGWQPVAEMRVQVQPRSTQVYIDGSYAGVADDFDGTFQRLRLAPGKHTLVLFHEGHRTVSQKIYVGPGSTFKIKHAMEPLAAGETSEPAPTPPEAPSAAAAVPVAPPQERARVSTAPAPDATSFGQLVLRTQPASVEVWIDGQRWPADSNGSLTLHLPAGVHRVELRHPGRRPFETEIEVRAGQARELNVQLPRDGGTL
jgi:hypothetical protein